MQCRKTVSTPRSMALPVEVVSACADRTHANEILQTDLGEGRWNVFSLPVMQNRLLRRAMTISEWRRAFFCDLRQWAMDGQEVPLIESKSYGQKHRLLRSTVPFWIRPAPSFRILGGSCASSASAEEVPMMGMARKTRLASSCWRGCRQSPLQAAVMEQR